MMHFASYLPLLLALMSDLLDGRIINSEPDSMSLYNYSPARPTIISNHIRTSVDQRPLYNIAHMSNSIKKTLAMIGRGANAVEVDVNFLDDDIILYHGTPCDCFRFCWDREPLDKYLMFARKISTPGYIDYEPRFVILYFDLKLRNFTPEEKYQQGIRFANHLSAYFFGDSNWKSTLRLIISISYTDDVDFLVALSRSLRKRNFYEQIKNRIGFDVGMDTRTEKIQEMWDRLNVTKVWQGEGITNCINPIIGHKLEKLTDIRDSGNSQIQKIYRWTVDLTDQIRSILRFNIDGIMTNHPERVAKIVQEDPEFNKFYRLATIHDDPFSKFDPRYSNKWNHQNEKTDPMIKEKFGLFLDDMRKSFLHFIYEIFQSLF